MNKGRIVFLPLARLTFDMESAKENLILSQDFLKSVDADILMPEGHITDYDMLKNYLTSIGKVDAVIIQASTFVDPRFALEYSKLSSAPILVWGIEEPSVGGRLRLNSLTGVYALTNIIYEKKIPFKMVVGAPTDKDTQEKLIQWIKAGHTLGKLRTMRLGMVGTIAPGYFFSLEEESMLGTHIGVTIVHSELHKLYNKIPKCDKAALQQIVKEASTEISGLEELPTESVMNFAGFYKVLEDFIKENQLDALTGRCWPDSFESLNIAACAVYSLLNKVVPIACEGDMGGAITNSILTFLSDKSAYFADPVQIHEKDDSITFWHCGYGSPTLADPKATVKAGLHHRGLGPTLDFPVKPGRVTLCRLGKAHGKYRMFLAQGEVLEKELQFNGTSAVVKLDGGAENFAQTLANEGWEYHISFVHADIINELKNLALMLNIDVTIV